MPHGRCCTRTLGSAHSLHTPTTHRMPLQAPKRIKLFVNQPTIGFSAAADASGVQELELSEAQLGGEQIPLK